MALVLEVVIKNLLNIWFFFQAYCLFRLIYTTNKEVPQK